jgi:hypothetical protein
LPPTIESEKLKSLIEKCSQSHPGSDLTFVGTNWLSGCLEKKQFLSLESFVLKIKRQAVESTATGPPKAGLPTAASPKTFSASKFVCAQSSSNPTSTNFNAAITEQLEKLAQTYKSNNDRLFF